MEEMLAQSAEEPVYKILLVEDSKPDAAYINRVLNDDLPGCDVTIVSSLGEAHQAYKEDFFHVVLLDLNLPDGFGAATVREMRHFNKSTPIIALTGMAADYAVDPALQNGAARVVLKSHLRKALLKETLEEFLA